MKILHLLDIPWWSGLSAYAFDSIRAHTSLGNEVLLLCEKGSLSHKKAAVLRIPTRPIFGRKSSTALFNFFLVGNAIRMFKPDRIVAHTGSTHWIAWGWGKMMKIPVLRTRSVSQKVRRSFLNRKIYAGSDWIVTASENLRREIVSRLSSDLEPRTRTLPPPVFGSDISHSEKRNGEGMKIGILARLDPVKGHSIFLQSAKIVQERFPGAEFHIAGSEENLKWHQLFSEIEKLKLKNVSYYGFLPQEKVAEFINSCQIGVISSLGSEEVSRALLEWMSFGKPVVATSVGSIPEILEDGRGGYIVPPRQPSELAGKIISLLSNPALSQQMGGHNRKLVKNRYSFENFKAGWKNLLGEPK